MVVVMLENFLVGRKYPSKYSGAKEHCTGNYSYIVYWEEIFVLYLQFFCKFASKLYSDNSI